VKLYHGLSFSHELDALEIAFTELYNVVDHFIVVEATRTWANFPKPLFFSPVKNSSTFAPFADKVRHVVVQDLPDEHIPCAAGPGNHCWGGHWIRETAQRNAIWDGVYDANDDDIILVTDVDEIIQERVLRAVKFCEGWPIPLHFHLRLGWFHFNFEAFKTTTNEPQFHNLAVALHKRNFTDRDMAPDHMRRHKTPDNPRPDYNADLHSVPDAGWHMGYFGTIHNIALKMMFAAHQENNTPDILEKLERCRVTGENPFGWKNVGWTIQHVYTSLDALPNLLQTRLRDFEHLLHPDRSKRFSPQDCRVVREKFNCVEGSGRTVEICTNNDD